jgi:hypothetical protein
MKHKISLSSIIGKTVKITKTPYHTSIHGHKIDIGGSRGIVERVDGTDNTIYIQIDRDEFKITLWISIEDVCLVGIEDNIDTVTPDPSVEQAVKEVNDFIDNFKPGFYWVIFRKGDKKTVVEFERYPIHELFKPYKWISKEPLSAPEEVIEDGWYQVDVRSDSFNLLGVLLDKEGRTTRTVGFYNSPERMWYMLKFNQGIDMVRLAHSESSITIVAPITGII